MPFSDDQICRALAVEDYLFLVELEAVGDGRDIAQANLGPAVATDHDQVLEFARVAAFVVEPDQDRGIGGLDGPGGQIHALACDDVGDPADAEPVLPERACRDLDANLVLREALDRDLGDAVDQQQVVLYAFREGLEIGRRHGAGDGHGRDQVSSAQLADHRPLGVLGEVVDRLYLGLDVVEEALDFAALAHLKGRDREAFARLAPFLEQILDSVDDVLDALANGLLDVGRRSAREHDADLDLVGGDVGKCLALDQGRRDQAGGQEYRHHQVRSRRVGGEEADHWTGPRPSASAIRVASASSSSTGSSSMPSMAGIRSEMTTRSPASRPARMAAKLV